MQPGKLDLRCHGQPSDIIHTISCSCFRNLNCPQINDCVHQYNYYFRYNVLITTVLFCPFFQVHHYIKYPDELQWNHVSSCILNGGGIRSSIDERSRNGMCGFGTEHCLTDCKTIICLKQRGFELLAVLDHKKGGECTESFFIHSHSYCIMSIQCRRVSRLFLNLAKSTLIKKP